MTTSVNTQVILSSNPDQLEEALSAFTTYGTVEAEYGDRLITGSHPELTLAHHGPRSGNPCPCLAPNLEGGQVCHPEDIEAVGISHVDLDTIGGILALMGKKPAMAPGFWECAAYVDVHGPHRLRECPEWSEEAEAQLNAFWAFSEANRVFAPRDGSVVEVTDKVKTFESVMTMIQLGHDEFMADGQAWAVAKADLEAKSDRGWFGPVVVREADCFVNHLYRDSLGKVAQAVVGYNSTTKAVTVSLESPIPGVSCRVLVQSLWGPEAGGHDGIAGSPRGQEMSFEDANRAAKALAVILEGPCVYGYDELGGHWQDQANQLRKLSPCSGPDFFVLPEEDGDPLTGYYHCPVWVPDMEDARFEDREAPAAIPDAEGGVDVYSFL